MRDDDAVEGVVLSERVNGWWVSVRDVSGREAHHGPYLDEESALSAAALLDPSHVPPEVYRPGDVASDG